jgi:hypothetical protein
VSDAPKKSRKRGSSCPKRSDKASCGSACSTDASPTGEKDKYLDECLALVPKLELGLDAIRSATIAELETLPSSAVCVIADGAVLHGLTDLACFAAAYKVGFGRAETGAFDATLIETLDKAFAILSLHLEVARANAAWNADWDRELLAGLLLATNSQYKAGIEESPLAKAKAAEIKWRKQDPSLWDGRESLFVKLWGALSQTAVTLSKVQWTNPVSSTKQPKRNKRTINEDDPFAEVFS